MTLKLKLANFQIKCYVIYEFQIQKEFQMIFNKLLWIQKYDSLIKKKDTINRFNRNTESSEDTIFSTRGRPSFFFN